MATALITLARAGGLQVLATSRDEAKRARALEIGAHEAFETGARLPERVDAVMETVGAATWTHSLRSLRPGRHGRDQRRDQRPEPRPRPSSTGSSSSSSGWSARRWAPAASWPSW